MTKERFIAHREVILRRERKVGIGFGITVLTTLFGTFWVSSAIERSRFPDWLTASLVILVLTVLMGGGILLVVLGNREQKRFGHRCPGCNKPIQQTVALIAIATGNCGYCGAKVFTDPPA